MIECFPVTIEMPSTVFAVKIAENKFKVARTAAEALQTVPKVLDLTSVGIGTTQSFTAKNLNSKVLVTLDNNIQSPVIQSPVEVKLSFDAASETDFITLTGISSFFSGDVIKVNDEFMKIDTVGIGTTQSFTAKNLNSKVLVTLDNNIQSPVIQSPVEVKLSFDAASETDFITLTGISSFFL